MSNSNNPYSNPEVRVKGPSGPGGGKPEGNDSPGGASSGSNQSIRPSGNPKKSKKKTVKSSGKSAKGGRPKTFVLESILLLLLCAGIFAVPALIFALQVDKKYQAGDFQGAQKASRNAKLWCIIAFGLIVLIFGIAMAIGIFLGLADIQST